MTVSQSLLPHAAALAELSSRLERVERQVSDDRLTQLELQARLVAAEASVGGVSVKLSEITAGVGVEFVEDLRQQTHEERNSRAELTELRTNLEALVVREVERANAAAAARLERSLTALIQPCLASVEASLAAAAAAADDAPPSKAPSAGTVPSAGSSSTVSEADEEQAPGRCCSRGADEPKSVPRLAWQLRQQAATKEAAENQASMLSPLKGGGLEAVRAELRAHVEEFSSALFEKHVRGLRAELSGGIEERVRRLRSELRSDVEEERRLAWDRARALGRALGGELEEERRMACDRAQALSRALGGELEASLGSILKESSSRTVYGATTDPAGTNQADIRRELDRLDAKVQICLAGNERLQAQIYTLRFDSRAESKHRADSCDLARRAEAKAVKDKLATLVPKLDLRTIAEAQPQYGRTTAPLRTPEETVATPSDASQGVLSVLPAQRDVSTAGGSRPRWQGTPRQHFRGLLEPSWSARSAPSTTARGVRSISTSLSARSTGDELGSGPLAPSLLSQGVDGGPAAAGRVAADRRAPGPCLLGSYLARLPDESGSCKQAEDGGPVAVDRLDRLHPKARGALLADDMSEAVPPSTPAAAAEHQHHAQHAPLAAASTPGTIRSPSATAAAPVPAAAAAAATPAATTATTSFSTNATVGAGFASLGAACGTACATRAAGPTVEEAAAAAERSSVSVLLGQPHAMAEFSKSLSASAGN